MKPCPPRVCPKNAKSVRFAQIFSAGTIHAGRRARDGGGGSPTKAGWLRGRLICCDLIRPEKLSARSVPGPAKFPRGIPQRLTDNYPRTVVVIARRGTFVSKIDISDLTAIYEARARIESWATRLAAERLREPDRREARELIDALKAITPPLELDALLALHRRIHRFIYRRTYRLEPRAQLPGRSPQNQLTPRTRPFDPAPNPATCEPD
jgi:FCD domain-containing protein